MNRATVGTTISLQTQRPLKTIKVSVYITMAPQPWTLAPRTPRRTRPRVFFDLCFKTQFLQELDINIAIQYQRRSLWGITDISCQGITLGYPFSFPSAYS